MAQSELTVLSDSLDIATVDRGVTAGQTPPNGGGTFVYGFNSLQLATGAVGVFANQVNFAPMASGGSVRAALKRGTSGGTTGWAPFLFIGLQGSSVNDTGYLLGLQDADPPHISLHKGTVAAGCPAGTPDPTVNGILRRSTNAVAVDQWVHLRLDMVVNGSGDVVLKVFQNDLTENAVDSPVWAQVTGMADFVDDSLAVNTGTAPYTSGRGGFAHQNSDVTRRSFVDQFQLDRQL